jgi:DNA-binding Lrp family transcriptional regulator
MRKNGVIKKFTIKRGKDSNIIMGVQTDPQMHTSGIVEKILGYGVEKVYELTGRFDVICHINSNDMEAANTIVEEIRTTQGVKATETFMVLKEN